LAEREERQVSTFLRKKTNWGGKKFIQRFLEEGEKMPVTYLFRGKGEGGYLTIIPGGKKERRALVRRADGGRIVNRRPVTEKKKK